MAVPANPLAPKPARPRGAKILAITGAVLVVLGFIGTVALARFVARGRIGD